MNQLNLAPIIIFCYNRPHHLEQTLFALKNADLSKASTLYVFSDAAKTDQDEINVAKVRKIINELTGFKDVIIKVQPTNKGLSASIISGVTEVIQKHGKAIVLEDDMLVSKNFLTYMNIGLQKYENEKTVSSVCSFMFPVNELPHLFFLRHSDCWGWATWEDRWANFEEDSKKLVTEIDEKNLISSFNFEKGYPYFQMLVDQSENRINSWAIRWYASNFLKNKIALYPGKSLIKNIGLDYSGTHSGIDKFMMTDAAYANLDHFPEMVEEDQISRKKISEYLKASYSPTFKHRLIKLFHKLGFEL